MNLIIVSGFVAALFAQTAVATSSADVAVVRCRVLDDAQSRVFELLRAGEGEGTRWTLAMQSRETGSKPVLLPLPGARPVITEKSVMLHYSTQNGGRDVDLAVAPAGASIDVHANYELEVNVDASLDPRVELMNTNGALTALSCALVH